MSTRKSHRFAALLPGAVLGLLLLPLVSAQTSPEGEPQDFAKIFAEAAASFNKGPDLDRDRGVIVFEAEEGTYVKGAHFGKWHWPEFTGDRWGMYQVEITYTSITGRMGFQFYIGNHQAKGYLPQSGGMAREHTAVLDKIYIPDTNTYNVGVLSGDDSKGPTFMLKRIVLRPAPEGNEVSQGIDGSITLAAGEAATFSRKMRYEPKETKNCLGFWTEPEDWAEWRFSVHDAGDFSIELFQGCGGGNHGSEVEVWINDEKRKFTVADTGGFQSWESIKLGAISLGEGDHRVTVKPINKTNNAVLDLHKVVLTPAG